MITIPRIYVRDNYDQVLLALDDGDYFNDRMTRYLTGKAAVLQLSIHKEATDYEMIKTGKKLSFVDPKTKEEFWLNISNVSQNETEMTILATSLNLELNNEIVGPYKTNGAVSFKDYFDILNFEKAMTLTINEVSDKKILLEWEGSQNKLGRLFSLATKFEAEIEFVTKLNRDGSLNGIIVNVYREHSDKYQGIGLDRRGTVFRFGDEIKTIKKQENADDLYTAIIATGKDGLTIKDVEHEVFDDNGNLLYCTYKTVKPSFPDVRKIYAPQSRENFRSTVSKEDGWIVNEAGEMEYTSAEALYGYMLSELKKNCVPQVTWEIEGYIDAQIGDSVRLADDGYQPELLLDARISEQTISYTNPTINKSVFTNVVEIASQIDIDLLNKMQALIDKNKKYEYQLLSSDGTIFKNGAGSTTLTARILDGTTDVTNKFTIQWYKNGTELSNETSITVTAADVTDGKAVYRYEVKDQGGNTRGGTEITAANVNDGSKSSTISPNPPQNPTTGQQWWKQNADNLDEIEGLYIWDGTEWIAQTIQQGVLNIVKLNAVDITGAHIVNTFSVLSEGYTLDGTTELQDSNVTIDFTVTETGQHGFAKLHPRGVQGVLYDRSGNVQESFDLNSSYLALRDNLGRSGMLTAEMIQDTGWVQLTVFIGSGKLWVRKFMNRTMLWFDDYAWNGSGQQVIATLPAKFNPNRAQMINVAIWNESSTPEKFQLNANGTLQKITNNSQTRYIRTFAELFK